MQEEIFLSGSKKMDGVLDLVNKDLLNVQIGRAKPGLVEGIQVEAYEGVVSEIRELASITASDPQNILIKPWDPSVVKRIEKAVRESSLNLNPVVDNDLIRIKIPSLTEERRKDLVRVIKQKIEAGKAMIRQVRLEIKKEIDKLKDEDGVSEDDIHGLYDKLQELVDEFNQKLDEMEESKEKELMVL